MKSLASKIPGLNHFTLQTVKQTKYYPVQFASTNITCPSLQLERNNSTKVKIRSVPKFLPKLRVNDSLRGHLGLNEQGEAFLMGRRAKRERLVNLFGRALLPPKPNSKTSSTTLKVKEMEQKLPEEFFKKLDSALNQIYFVNNIPVNERQNFIIPLIEEIYASAYHLSRYPELVRFLLVKLIQYDDQASVEQIFGYFIQSILANEPNPNSKNTPNHLTSPIMDKIMIDVILYFQKVRDLDKLYAVQEVVQELGIDVGSQLDFSFSLVHLTQGDFAASQQRLTSSIQYTSEFPPFIYFTQLFRATFTVHPFPQAYIDWLEQFLDYVFPPSHIPGRNQPVQLLKIRLELCNSLEKLSHLIDLSNSKLVLGDLELQSKIIDKGLKLLVKDGGKIADKMHIVHGWLWKFRTRWTTHISSDESESVRHEIDPSIILKVLKASCEAKYSLSAIQLYQSFISSQSKVSPSIIRQTELAILKTIQEGLQLYHPSWKASVLIFIDELSKKAIALKDKTLIYQLASTLAKLDEHKKAQKLVIDSRVINLASQPNLDLLASQIKSANDSASLESSYGA